MAYAHPVWVSDIERSQRIFNKLTIRRGGDKCYFIKMSFPERDAADLYSRIVQQKHWTALPSQPRVERFFYSGAAESAVFIMRLTLHVKIKLQSKTCHSRRLTSVSAGQVNQVFFVIAPIWASKLHPVEALPYSSYAKMIIWLVYWSIQTGETTNEGEHLQSSALKSFSKFNKRRDNARGEDTVRKEHCCMWSLNGKEEICLYNTVLKIHSVPSIPYFLSVSGAPLLPPPHLSFSPWHSDTYQVAGPISKMLSGWFSNIRTDHSIIPRVWGGDFWESVEC